MKIKKGHDLFQHLFKHHEKHAVRDENATNLEAAAKWAIRQEKKSADASQQLHARAVAATRRDADLRAAEVAAEAQREASEYRATAIMYVASKATLPGKDDFSCYEGVATLFREPIDSNWEMVDKKPKEEPKRSFCVIS